MLSIACVKATCLTSRKGLIFLKSEGNQKQKNWSWFIPMCGDFLLLHPLEAPVTL